MIYIGYLDRIHSAISSGCDLFVSTPAGIVRGAESILKSISSFYRLFPRHQPPRGFEGII